MPLNLPEREERFQSIFHWYFDDSSENDQSVNSEENRLIEITVKDTGVGISSSNLEKIFTRFFQVGDGASQTGTGIGLALTKELVKLHNGKLFCYQ